MKYYILLDSSSTFLTVGVATKEKLVDYTSYESWQTQSENMIPELNKLLEKHSITNSDIEGVIVAIGPGSYTGVRISITIAKTIATALLIDVYPVSSLQVLKDNTNKSICLINARSNRSYVGVYDDNKVLLSDCIMTNEEALKYIEEHKDYSICGNTKYLGIEGKMTNIAEQLFSLIDKVNKIENPLALKPVYMKD